MEYTFETLFDPKDSALSLLTAVQWNNLLLENDEGDQIIAIQRINKMMI